MLKKLHPQTIGWQGRVIVTTLDLALFVLLTQARLQTREVIDWDGNAFILLDGKLTHAAT
jgi:hypothetical protein